MRDKSKVALASVAAAVGLTSFKLVVGLITGSLGILSEAIHSALDLVAAVITFFAVRISDKPANRIFNYGHGKIENFSALVETFLLLITCSWIIYEAIGRLVSGKTHIEINVWSFVVVITSMIIDISRSRALYKVARKHNSQALEADALHFSTDIWSSAVVLLGLICASFGFFFADSVAALVVAAIVLLICFRLGKKAVDVLLDKAPGNTVDSVKKLLYGYREIKHFHGLKIRTAGADTFIKVNIHLDPNLKLSSVHQLCDQIEKDLNKLIPRSEVYIHAEPQEFTHLISELNREKL